MRQEDTKPSTPFLQQDPRFQPARGVSIQAAPTVEPSGVAQSCGKLPAMVAAFGVALLAFDFS
jgi:hypothetical protein